MKKKILSLLLLSAMTVGVISGCGKSDAGSNKLYVYNWGEYIDEDVITQFEEETGIDVVYDMFETNEIMFAKLAQDIYEGRCENGIAVSFGSSALYSAVLLTKA